MAIRICHAHGGHYFIDKCPPLYAQLQISVPCFPFGANYLAEIWMRRMTNAYVVLVVVVGSSTSALPPSHSTPGICSMFSFWH